MTSSKTSRTPPYVRYLDRITRNFPDFDFPFIKRVRSKAVELLRLSPGNRVLDVGCGSGGSFPFLQRAVGPEGSVIGVEISPESAESARRRVAKNQWKIVTVAESDARDFSPEGRFDGLLMFAAPDIFAKKETLEHILNCMKKGARVAAFGAKLSDRGLGRILNPVLTSLFRLSFATTPRPEHEPWGMLADYCEDIEVHQYFFGLMFLFAGSYKGKELST